MRNTGRSIGELPDARGRDMWHDRRPSGVCLLRPDPFGDVELHSAAECFIPQMRICNLRVRIVRDGHEPNEAEEQRPCCVPIEPVHVISSPKDRREQEGYQNSGSSVKIAGVTSQVSILLPAPSPRLRHFATPFPMAKHRVPDRATDHLVRRSRSSCHLLALKHPSRPWCLDCFHPIPDSFIHREHWCSGTPP